MQIKECVMCLFKGIYACFFHLKNEIFPPLFRPVIWLQSEILLTGLKFIHMTPTNWSTCTIDYLTPVIK